MEHFERRVSVIDMAYEIINMDQEIAELTRQRDHYKGMHEDNMKSMDSSANHTKEMIGTMLGAVLDPDSFINKGQRAITELELREQRQ